jgi:Polyketide cyclase / dehydrase and lipid transport
MGNDDCKPVSVSRRIEASASVIFAILAHPDRHPEFDGSEMLRTGASNAVITCVGDVFVTKMYFTAMGDYEMHNRIVAFEQDRCIAWEPGNPELARNGSRWRYDLIPDGPNATVVTETYDCTESPESVREAVDNGNAWLAGMTKTLERLDEVCTTQ